MSKVGTWSTTAGNNSSAAPNGFPEGMAPSGLNDAAREVMAAVRTVFNDAQFFDQDFTPTYVSATQFSVTGNQTSAIHAGRRLKIFDATAGVATVIYATVTTASFTAVTNIHVATDGGQLTSSLSSFAISILSQTPRAVPDNISAVAVNADTLTSSAVVASAVLRSNGTFTASGASVCKTTLLVEGATTLSGTAITAQVLKAGCDFSLAAAGIADLTGVWNVASVSRSAVGVVRVNFSNALADAAYICNANCYGGGALAVPSDISKLAGSVKMTFRNAANAATDNVQVHITVFR